MKVLNVGLGVFLLVLLGIIGSATFSRPRATPTSTSTPETHVAAVEPQVVVTPTPNKLFMPAIFSIKPGPPLYSTSYYMLTVDGKTLYDMGCKLGQLDRDLPGSRDSLTVLDFGSPAKVGNEYGTDLFWMGPVGISKITAGVKNFGAGYYACVSTDKQSKMYVGIGTTNYHTSISNTTDFTNHGVAWARMVNDINAWFGTQGYSSQVLAVGANDIELAWNTPAITKAWVNGYNSAHKFDWYDFGALDGCATRSNPNSTLCGNGWTREDAWYVVYGTRPAWPLPEIYLTNGLNAQQWALLSLYSASAKGYPFVFIGVFTQMQACIQATGQCPGVDNSPTAGWNQMYAELNKDARTIAPLPWSTDIKWWDGKVTLNSSVQPAQAPSAPAGASFYQSIADALKASLSSASVGPEDRQLLEGKLENAQRVLDLQSAAASQQAVVGPKALSALPKVIDVDFPSGIFDGPGGAFHAWEGAFANHWQGKVDGDYVFVSAGSASIDTTHGVLSVVRISADRLQVTKNTYQAPAGSGALQVQKVQWPSVQLVSTSGAQFTFNADQQIFAP